MSATWHNISLRNPTHAATVARPEMCAYTGSLWYSQKSESHIPPVSLGKRRHSYVTLPIMNSKTTHPGVSLQPHIITMKFCSLSVQCLALSLFVLRVLTDNSDAALPLNYLALFANRFYRRSHLHLLCLLPWKSHFTLFPALLWGLFQKRPANIIALDAWKSK